MKWKKKKYIFHGNIFLSFLLFRVFFCCCLFLFRMAHHCRMQNSSSAICAYCRTVNSLFIYIYIWWWCMLFAGQMGKLCRSHTGLCVVFWSSVWWLPVWMIHTQYTWFNCNVHLLMVMQKTRTDIASNAFRAAWFIQWPTVLNEWKSEKKNITTDPRPWIGTASDYAGSRPTKVVSIRRTSDALTTHRMPMHEDNDKNRCLAGMDREYSLWCTARPSARHCLGRNLFWTRRASGRVFFIGVGPQVLWIVCTIAMCAVA